MKKQKKAQAGDGGQSAPSPIIHSMVGPTIGSPMMRIRMLKSAGTSFGVLQYGTVHDIPERFAQGWIAAGIAKLEEAKQT